MNITVDIPNLPGMQPHKDTWVHRQDEGFKKVKSRSSRPSTAGAASRGRSNDNFEFAPKNSQKELVRPASASALRPSGSRNQSEPMTPMMRATAHGRSAATLRPKSSSNAPDGIYGAAIGTLGLEEEKIAPKFMPSPQKVKNVPDFVERDRIVCRVFGHFTQRRPWDRGPLGVPEAEESMVRHLTILFYVRDQTVEMSERKFANSGMSGGAFCARRRLKKLDGTPVAAEDLAPGNTLQVLGIDIYITDADSFTRDYFRRELNMQLPPMLSRPVQTPFTNGAQYATGLFSRTTVGSPSGFADSSGKTKSTDYEVVKERLEKTNRFLKYDGQILRFQAVELPLSVTNELGVTSSPKNTKTRNGMSQEYPGLSYQMRGDEKLFGVLFYLSDASIEVRAIKGSGAADSGADAACVVRRGKVPKNWREVQRGASAVYYEPVDLICGNIIDIYGKVMLITNCNKYTKRVFSDLEIELTPIELISRVENKVRHPVPAQGDGFLNIGSNADTLATCYGSEKLVKDTSKAQRNQNRTLRCKLKALKDQGASTRSFLLTYYLEDDTLQIYEEVVRNSGYSGGNFLRRGIYENHLPDDSYSSGKSPGGIRNFQSNDIYLGNVISVNGMEMQITEIDNLSLRFCESYPKEFPMFDAAKVVERMLDNVIEMKVDLRKLIGERFDLAEKGYLSKNDFLTALEEAKLLRTLNEQELLTLFRRFRYCPNPPAGNGRPAPNDYVYMYHELCDLISHQYCLVNGLQATQFSGRPARDNLDSLLCLLRQRPTSWRRSLKRDDPCTVGNFVTFGQLLELFTKKGVQLDNLLGPKEKSIMLRYYGVSETESGPILSKIKKLQKVASRNLLAESKKKQLASAAPKKVDAGTIRNRREQLMSEIAKSRAGYTSPGLGSGNSLGSESVVLDDSEENLLINFHDLCNDIYVCDW